MRGSIVKRGKKYSIVVDIYDENNVRKKKFISGYERKKDAEADLPRILSEIQGGVFVEERKITFCEYADKWLKYVEGTISESTYTTYKWVMDKAKERFKMPLIKIKPLMIQDFLGEHPKLSKTSVRYIYRVLNISFIQAIRWQLLVNNPCEAVTPPQRNKKAFKPYSDTQIKELIEGSRKTPIFIPVLLAITCGMRRGEICSLDWKDIDFDRNTLTITDGKTDNSVRTISVPDFVMEEIKPLSGIGNVVNLQPDYVYKRFKKLITELKLPEISFHDLRHFCASWLLKNGVPITVVSSMLGHSSKGFTLDTYSHLLPDMTKHASDVMNTLGSNSVAKKKKASKRNA